MSVLSRLRAVPDPSPASASRWLRRRPRPSPELRFWQEPLTADHERLQLTARP